MDLPPRKVKPLVVLKDTTTEQVNKLTAKHQVETDILEDIRSFSKQRAVIEKEYGQALSKLALQYSAKKEQTNNNIPSSQLHENGEENRSASCVWRAFLQKADKVGKSHLVLADVYQQQLSDVSSVKTRKIQTFKKMQDQLLLVQAELGHCIRDLSKSQTTYTEEERRAHDTRQKSMDYDERLKKKITGVFQSMSTLKRNSAKFSSKRSSCEVRSTGARNQYMLNIAASNAHQTRYYSVEIPGIIQTMDGECSEKISNYIDALAKNEVSVSQTTVESLKKVQLEARMINNEQSLQNYLTENPVFTETIQYEFEPCENDPVNSIIIENQDAEKLLEKDAKKLATKIAKETKALRIYKKLMTKLQNQLNLSVVDKRSSSTGIDKSDKSSLDPEAKVDLLKDYIRKAETAKVKAEAKLELLREGGVKVDEFLNNAMKLARDDQDDISRTVSQMSFKTEMSEDDDILQDEYLDETFDETIQINGYTDTDTHVKYPRRCYALYDFKSHNSDELNFKKGEQLFVTGPGDGDGWLLGRLADDTEGYIPENYVDYYDTTGAETEPQSPKQDTHSENKHSAEGGVGPLLSPHKHHIKHKALPMQETGDDIWARALYDYHANAAEELTFVEGQIIRILRKDENGIDDGWWEGEIDGHVGVFPSLVVEELPSEDTDKTLVEDNSLPPPPPDPPIESNISINDTLPPPPPPPIETTSTTESITPTNSEPASPTPPTTPTTPIVSMLPEVSIILPSSPNTGQPKGETKETSTGIIFKPAIRPNSIKPVQTVQPVVLAKQPKKSPTVSNKDHNHSPLKSPVIVLGNWDKSPGAKKPIVITRGPVDKNITSAAVRNQKFKRRPTSSTSSGSQYTDV